MRRPLISIALAMNFGIVAAYFEKEKIEILVTAMLFSVAVFLYFIFQICKSKVNKNVSTYTSEQGFKEHSNQSYSSLQFQVFLVLLAFILGAVMFDIRLSDLERQGQVLCEKTVITGEIIDVRKSKEDYFKLTVKTNQGKLLVCISEEIKDYRILKGLIGEFHGNSEIPCAARNPHCFNYKLYLMTKGISTIMKADSHIIRNFSETYLGNRLESDLADKLNNKEVKISDKSNKKIDPARKIENDNSIKYYERKLRHSLAMWKADFCHIIEGDTEPEISGILCGILFGDIDDIDEESVDKFRKNGTAHILAVSGLHVGIVYAFIDKLTGKRKSKRIYLLKAAVIILYAAVSGFAPSTTRACIMILFHIYSGIRNLRYDMLSALAACEILNLIINPMALFGVGFQLSYIAIASMAVLVGRFKGKQNLIISAILLQLGLAPLMAYHFNCFSYISILLNIPVLYLAGLTVPIGIILLYMIPLITLITTFISYVAALFFTTDYENLFKGIISINDFLIELAAGFSDIIVKCLTLLTGALIKLNEFAYMKGEGFTYCKSPQAWLLVLYYGIIFLCFSEFGFICFKRKNKKRILQVSCILIALTFATAYFSASPFDKSVFTFVDVGQGDCLHIKTASGKNVLIDGGGSAFKDIGEKILLPYLLKNGASGVDLAVVTHLHTDHYEGIRSLSGLMRVKTLAVSSAYTESEVRSSFPDYRGELIFLKDGDVIKVDEDTSLKVFATGEGGESENAKSLIMKVFHKGVSVLMTADIDQAGEKMLIDKSKDTDLQSTLLKVAHHGSRYSSCNEFIDEVKPQAVVIQVGKNVYGHPSSETLERFEEKDIPIFRNDQMGAVVVSFYKGKLKIVTML